MFWYWPSSDLVSWLLATAQRSISISISRISLLNVIWPFRLLSGSKQSYLLLKNNMLHPPLHRCKCTNPHSQHDFPLKNQCHKSWATNTTPFSLRDYFDMHKTKYFSCWSWKSWSAELSQRRQEFNCQSTSRSLYQKQVRKKERSMLKCAFSCIYLQLRTPATTENKENVKMSGNVS